MDSTPPRDVDFVVDLESGGATGEEAENADPVLSARVVKTFFNKVCSEFVSADGSNNGEKKVVSLSACVSNSNGAPLEDVKLLMEKKVEGDEAAEFLENRPRKERRLTTSAKKPPRPPRPPKAMSLDAADQKLIKEIAELAMMKRARIERMKASKKMKAAKASMSTGSFFATLFTIIFCIVIVFQGMSSGKSTSASFQGSPESAQAANSSFISVYYQRNTSASDDIGIPGSGSPSVAEQVSVSDPGDNARRAVG